jgi:hypothetical protein
MNEKPSAILPGTVEKIIKSPIPNEPEKAQIAVEGADHLYREIRITNTLTRENGDEVSLKPGAQVEVTVEPTQKPQPPRNNWFTSLDDARRKIETWRQDYNERA